VEGQTGALMESVLDVMGKKLTGAPPGGGTHDLREKDMPEAQEPIRIWERAYSQPQLWVRCLGTKCDPRLLHEQCTWNWGETPSITGGGIPSTWLVKKTVCRI
jgi:hypothetical protein